MSVSSRYQSLVESGKLHESAEQRAVLSKLDQVLEDLAVPAKRGFFRKTQEPVRGLYMWGGVGVGKSMLMDLLVEEAEVPKERQHFHAFMQWVHASMTEARKTGVDDAIAPVADDLAGRVRLLAFDEMQITDITDAMIVGRLFEQLFAQGVAIVTTSNRPPDDLYKHGLNRQLFVPFIELLKEHMAVHDMASETDYRQGRLSGTQTYFTPANAEAREQIDQIWSDLTDDRFEPFTLKVKGREVEIPMFANSVARIGFYDLCGKPLGAADYLALADAVRVLILENIPQLSRQNFNEAKRFVTLIDALYEAKVQLICSAAERPEMLYVEGEGSFEFGRTASRLQEMQSDDWAGQKN